MSYNIGLYQKSFLKKTTEQDLEDWTKADVIETTVREKIKERLIDQGYILESDSRVSTEFMHPNDKWGLQVCIFKGEISFSTPYWDDAENAVEEARRSAKLIAREFN